MIQRPGQACYKDSALWVYLIQRTSLLPHSKQLGIVGHSGRLILVRMICGYS
jgi:hypothetical protein